jgi:hypothetical protein
VIHGGRGVNLTLAIDDNISNNLPFSEVLLVTDLSSLLLLSLSLWLTTLYVRGAVGDEAATADESAATS